MRNCLGATLQSGNKLVASGYCLYSAATSFVFSFGGKSCQVRRTHGAALQVSMLLASRRMPHAAIRAL